MNLLKCSVGTGIWALGVAFSNSGMIFGIFLMIFITLLYTYCVHILVSKLFDSSMKLIVFDFIN